MKENEKIEEYNFIVGEYKNDKKRNKADKGLKNLTRRFTIKLLANGYRYHKIWGWVKKNKPLDAPRKEDGTIRTKKILKAFSEREQREIIKNNGSWKYEREEGNKKVYSTIVIDYGNNIEIEQEKRIKKEEEKRMQYAIDLFTK